MAAERCKCGGSWVQHTNDEEGCWCGACLHSSTRARCQVWDPTEPVAKTRKSDPPTSRLAAESLTSRQIRSGQEAVLNSLRMFGPMTDEELFERVKVAHKMSDSGCRTRRSELVARGVVKKTDEVRKTKHGYKAIVWAADDGQTVLGEE